jgi:hypothetical protein
MPITSLSAKISLSRETKLQLSRQGFYWDAISGKKFFLFVLSLMFEE